MVFYDVPLIFKVFINIHKYANKVIGSSGDELKGTWLTLNLVVYDKYQLLYDLICMYSPPTHTHP